MKSSLLSIFSFAVWILPLSSPQAQAANVSSSWNGGDSGAYSWETDSNWTTIPDSPYPNNNASNKFLVTVGDSTDNRLISTNEAITVSRLFMTQNSSSGSLTLKLGGDFMVASDAGSAYSSFVNTTNDASKFVIDLNGYNFEVKGVADKVGSIPYFTLTGGGTFTTSQYYHSSATRTAVVGAGVTVEITGSTIYAQYLAGTTWDPTSTFKFSTNNAAKTTIYHTGTSLDGIGNLIIGDRGNTVASWAGFSSAALYIKGNVDILSYQGAPSGGAAKMTIGDSAKFYIAGNFTDEGSDLEDYGKGTFVFNGGQNSERVLSTGRANLSTSFQVGDNTTTPGNLRLGKDLTTTGKFTVLKESRLNVDKYGLKSATVDIQSSSAVRPTLAFSFGSGTTGYIEATGALTLNYANIDVSYDGTGWEGGDLVLFRFDSLTTAPSLANLIVNINGNFTHEGLVVDANSIYLSNVTIPEPRAAMLFLLSGFAVAWNFGRRWMRAGTNI